MGALTDADPEYHDAAFNGECLWVRIRENLLHPAEFCRRYREESLTASLKYYGNVVALSFIIQIAALILLAVIPQAHDELLVKTVFGGFPPALFIIAFIILCVPLFVVYLFYPFIGGMITHIGVLIVGGKQGMDKTIQAGVYYLIPYFILPSILILCLVPAAICYTLLSLNPGNFFIVTVFAFVVMGLVILWILIISIIALRELQFLPTLRAAFAALFPVILMLAVMLLFFGYMALVMVMPPAAPQADQPVQEYHKPSVINTVGSPLILTADELPASLDFLYAMEWDLAMVDYPSERFGVQKIYHVQYTTQSQSSEDGGTISHDIMFFPPGRAAEMMAAEVVSYQPDSSGLPRALPCPDIGDANACFETLETNKETGEEFTQYVLIFSKGDLVEIIATLDPDLDFDLVKEIAIRSAAKIPVPDRVAPGVTQTTVTTPAQGRMTTVSFYDQIRPDVNPASVQSGYHAEHTVTILFTSTDPPDVNIRLDNVDRGVTPLMVTDVPFDSHTVYAYREGYVPQHTFVYADSSRSFFERKITLERNPAE